MKKLLLVAGMLFSVFLSCAQPDDFDVFLEETQIPGLEGMHSYAFAQHQSQWLIAGGRLNGLHAYLPPTAFPIYTQNNTLTVIDVNTQQFWASDAIVLPDSVREHITSSNMEYHQSGDYLYFIGGYGWSTPDSDFVTFPKMTAIQVPGLIQAIKNQMDITPYFRQITDSALAVTGGQLAKLGDTYYLVWGHNFKGRYNHTNGPTFTQTYSYQIRKFEIVDDGVTLSLSNYSAITDSANFRRRDFNLSPQIFPDGTEGLRGFTGVFQPQRDIPYLNSVDITPSGYTVNNTFQQKLNQYHTARLPVYDSVNNAMHTVFFGGIGQYYPDSLNPNLWVEDTLVPFVRTISRITHYNNATFEMSLPLQMPGFIGSNAEFIPLESSIFRSNGILRLNALDTTKVLIGHIWGGIESPRKNIFKGSESESFASPRIFEVYLKKSGQITNIHPVTLLSEFKAYPNPARGKMHITFSLKSAANVKVYITDSNGRTIETLMPVQEKEGAISLLWNSRPYSEGLYFCNVQINGVMQGFPVIVR
ncbi:MAG: T9SS type A sorting domain-containing protein [Bacteroidia bacterium]|nr:T9SS type A sorting domain-containing protein [Bacteroidia bacterium]